MSALTEIPSEDHFAPFLSSLSSSTLIVLYFHAPWAAPCAQMRTVLEAIAGQYPATSPPSISFVSINAEELPDVSEDFDVTAVPFVVLMRNGQKLEEISGSDAVKVRTAIERHAGGAASADGAGRANIPVALAATPRENGPDVATQPPVIAQGAPGPAANATAVASAPALTPEQSKEALWARLDELTKAASVMLFMKGTPSSPQCGFSRQLVGILRERSVKYGFFNILADEDVRQGLKEYAEWPTFPQLWVEGELVGGLDIVREEIENDPSFLDKFSVSKP
ncbi:Monothiol glutaredoxin-4 [Penicillium macrosclerotiorum]|uniref:Monothiol glutaredoxin-4 n=1 Tax=Penicillium macrosclerotiorum TaxID=303699 RepID=UPI002547825C|nr:Monothiol glutaredoxin-4 [Penicillium macrosclerotiorum]KAJ5698776.1 Monothiol glutaredoxin-4 [Penicillium macrosclerotiorum]